MPKLNCFDSMNTALFEVRVLESAEGFISVDAAATTKRGEGIDSGVVECGLHRVKDCAKCGKAQRKRASRVHYA